MEIPNRSMPAMMLRLWLGLLILSAVTGGVPAQETATAPEDREAALLFNTASRLYRQKTWRDAAAAFGDFLKRFPRHPDAGEAHFARGFCLNRLSQHAAAAGEFQAAEAALAGPVSAPNSPPEGARSGRQAGSSWAAEAWFYHGRSLEALAAEQPAGSSRRREELLRAAEKYAEAARLARARQLSAPAAAGAPTAKGGARPAEGGGEATKGGREPPDDLFAPALTSQGEALYQAGSHAEAEKALAPFERDAASFRGSAHLARGLYLLALARYARDEARGADPEEACALLERLAGAEFANDPVAEEAEFFLAGILDRRGKRREAAQRWSAVIRRGGAHAAEASFSLAVSLYESRGDGDLARAQEELQKFLEKNPGHALAPRARFYHALCLFDSRRYREAAAGLREVAGGGGEIAGRAWLRLGQALLLQETPEPEQAAVALDQAIRALEGDKWDATAQAASPAAEALYWKGEALLARGGAALGEAARLFEDFAERRGRAAPELAEKALYQAARASFLAGERRPAADLARRYRERYPPPKARFFPESLQISAENALRDSAEELPAAERAAAAGYYAQAAALARDPAQARRLRYLSGVASYHQGDRAAAARILEEVEAENRARPLAGFQEPELSFYLANALAAPPAPADASPEEVARWKRAASLFARYLENQAGGQHAPAALVNLGLCRQWLGELEEARKVFSAFLEKHPDHPRADQVRFDLAGLQLRGGDLEPALAAYRQVAETSRDAALAERALLQTAVLERRLKRPADALKTLGKLEGKRSGKDGRADPLLLDAGFERAMALSESGKGREAQLELARYLEHAPRGPRAGEARIQLAHLLLDANEPQQALEAIVPLMEVDPAPAERDQALYLRAWCFRQLRGAAPAAGKEEKDSGPGGDGARAAKEIEASYRRLIAEHPRSPFALDARVELAQHLYQERSWKEARQCFEEARELLEQSSSDGRSRDLLERCLFGLGFLAFEEERFDEARRLLERVAERSDGELAPRAIFHSARACLRSGREKEAAERFEKLLGDELRPRARDLLEETHLRLAECYHRLSRYQEAAAVLATMLKEFPEGSLRHEGLFALGFALQFQDRTGEAIETYRKVVAATSAPVAARAQYHLGECFMDQKKYREAAREFLTVPANFDFEGPYREWVRRALLGAGMAYQADGDREAARAQYQELVKRFGETDEGRTAQKRLLEVKP